MTETDTIRKRLVSMRKEAGITQAEMVARGVFSAQPAVSLFEARSGDILLSTVIKYLDVLELNLEIVPKESG